MPRLAKDTRDRVVTAAYGLFYKKGFARVGVDAIAAAAGVTKRTLYNHFASKDALLAAVLERQQEQALAQIRGWSDSAADAASPAAFLAAIFAALEAWARQRRWQGSGFSRLAMELADLPGHPARKAARAHKKAVESWLGDELTRRGAERPDELARQTALLLEGSLSLMLIHGDTRYAAAAADAAARLAGDVSR
jgi:AcrR family transcriptional regulator